jgi:hypothetical protein
MIIACIALVGRVKLLLTPAGKENRATLPRADTATAQGHSRVPRSHLALVFVVADRGGNDSGKSSTISVARPITLKA